MRFADRIALHSEAVDELRRQQIMAIRDEVTAQKLSVHALGRLVGQHDLRAINDPAWWPSQEMLDKLEVALFGGRGIPREPLVSAEIVDPDRLGTRASRNVQAMEIWREVGGVWTDGLASRLTEAGILAQSTIILDRERGLWVDKRYDEYGFWGSMTDDHGVYLFDRPDPTFNAENQNQAVLRGVQPGPLHA